MAEYRTDQYRAAFRATLHPDYEGISDEQADALFTNVVAGMSPPEADAYMEGLGSFFKQAVNTVARTAPIWAPIAGAAVGSIVPGAGTAIGGAVGGIAGNVAAKLAAEPKASAGSLIAAGVQGGIASRTGAASGGQPAAAGLASAAIGLVGSALGGGGGAGAATTAAAPAPRAMPTPGPGPASASVAVPGAAPSRPAANQLLSLLNNPHFDRAVLGQANGAIGRSSMPVRAGGRSHQVPFGAFLNALIQLAQLAAAEATDAEGSSTSYLTDSEGTYAYDPASPEQRAEALLALLDAEYEERATLPEEPTIEYADDAAAAPVYDPLTEWFLSSGMIH